MATMESMTGTFHKRESEIAESLLIGLSARQTRIAWAINRRECEHDLMPKLSKFEFAGDENRRGNMGPLKLTNSQVFRHRGS